jgi:hypothetical protein
MGINFMRIDTILKYISLIIIIPSLSFCKTIEPYEDKSNAPSIALGINYFENIKPKFKEGNSNNQSHKSWIWKYKDQWLAMMTVAAGPGLIYNHEYFNSKEIIETQKFFKNKNIENITRFKNIKTRIGYIDAVSFTYSEKSCFSTRAYFNSTDLDDEDRAKQIIIGNYCESGNRPLSLSKIKFHLSKINVGQQGFEKPLVDGVHM